MESLGLYKYKREGARQALRRLIDLSIKNCSKLEIIRIVEFLCTVETSEFDKWLNEEYDVWLSKDRKTVQLKGE